MALNPTPQSGSAVSQSASSPEAGSGDSWLRFHQGRKYIPGADVMGVMAMK